MASPNTNWSEIVTTTLYNRTGKLADNVTRNNMILMRLSEKDNIEFARGGVAIAEELEYAQNSTFQWYSGAQALNIQGSQVFTAAQFNWRQAAVAVMITGLEQRQNYGKYEVINLVAKRVKNAEKTMENGVAAALYSNGTNTMQIGGLQLLIADTPTSGTVGGINRTTWPFWQNISYSGVTNGGAAVGVGNIQTFMNSLYVQLVRGRDSVDLIMSDNNYYLFYLNSLQAIQRITNTKLAEAGFKNLEYMGADVVLDGGFQGYSSDTNPSIGGCPANHMYFMNTDYIKFRPHPDMNMVPMDPENRFSVNQDAVVKLIGFMGNLTASNCRMQGVLIA